MPMPTVVGVGSPSTAAGGGNLDLPYPAAYTAVDNDVAVAFVETSTEVVTAPAGYAIAAQVAVSSGTLTRLTSIWKRLVGGEANPFVNSSTFDHASGSGLIVVRGVRTVGNPFEAAPASTELVADTTVSIPGTTTTVANCLMLYAFTTGQDVGSTAGATGWADASLANIVERADWWSSLGDGGGVAVASGEKVTAGATGAMTATLSLTANFKTLMSMSLVGAAPMPPDLRMAPHRRPIRRT